MNNDNKVDMLDAMLLTRLFSGFSVELSEQGMKAALSIYPEEGKIKPGLNDL